MTHPYFHPDDDDEHRLPLDPPATRGESQSDSAFTDYLEHELLYGRVKKLADDLYAAGPMNGPGDGLAQLETIQRLNSVLFAATSVIMADSVEQVAQIYAEDTVAKPHLETEQQRRDRLSANYYRVDPTSDQIITSNFVAEASVALRETNEKVRSRMFTAKGLRHICSETLQALIAGDITPAAAKSIVKYSQDLTEEQIDLMQHQLLPVAATASDETIAQRARRFHDRANPEAANERHENALEARKISGWDLPDGMAALKVYGPAEDIRSVLTTLRHVASQNNDAQDTRTQAQLEVDIFFDAMINGWPGSNGSPLKPRVVVTIPALQMIANPETAMADLEGYGPIPMGVALKIAKDAPSIIPMLTDPFSGAVMDVGRKRYKPTRVLKEFLRARDQHCCFPGCRRTADNSEVDHVDAWETGGHTNRKNTELLCKQHQMFKHALGWQVINGPDGSKSWRTPHGLSSVVVPGSVENVERFEHANDRCPERELASPDDLRRLLGNSALSDDNLIIRVENPTVIDGNLHEGQDATPS